MWKGGTADRWGSEKCDVERENARTGEGSTRRGGPVGMAHSCGDKCIRMA